MTFAIAPMSAEHIPEAAALYDRWSGHSRKSRPPGAPTGQELLGRLLAEPDTEAYFARDSGGRPAGYLAASPLDLAEDTPGALRSHPRSAVVRHGGHAPAPGQRDNAALLALYAEAAARLVAQRRLVHYVELPASGTAAMDWCQLGFGFEEMYGLMAVKPRGRQPRGVDGLSIRRAGPGDLPQIGRMAAESARYQRESAMFLPQSDAALAAMRTRYTDTLSDPRCAAWIAGRGGEEIGMVLLAPSPAGPVTPDGCVELAEAYVEPSARGEGVSRILLATAAAWAYDHEYRHIGARWHSASPLAAGHWPAVGFRVAAYRLSRVLDPRIRPGHASGQFAGQVQGRDRAPLGT
ncbi:GNAT family N-acetyltransferase [Streptomyces sp. RKAG293]|uniref:GNAT family N-acetyltransferase n=1 Tax=Streptomyces sp. RKAG293 TaxID=2893403 RepID=UPI002033A42D|nr:GNAT family N-acetyltransferase [Streptomyces sp. RKAG293]MCM2418191.1 GNAT family N-acetyltransferase [Streptomyces sp. RKAG293]